MEIKLQNVGKLSSADVMLEGITVIAGENDTGKSTVGKTLFSILNGLFKINERLQQQKEINLQRQVERVLRVLSNGHSINSEIISDHIREKASSLTESEIDDSWVTKTINEAIAEFLPNDCQLLTSDTINKYPAINHVLQNIRNIISYTMESVAERTVQRIFRAEFGLIPKSYYSNDEECFAEVINHSKTVKVSFHSFEDIVISGDYISDCEAFIIDDTGVIDQHYDPDQLDLTHKSHLRWKLFGKTKSDDTVSDLLVSTHIESALNQMNAVCNGNLFIVNGDVSYQKNGDPIPTPAVALSEGLKAFVILRSLLMNSVINENIILILDEPEIHVHPEWQIILAELIVVIHKEFNQRILITTHSPYFLEAIEVFSERHNVNDHCKYYMAETEGDAASIIDATDNIEKIYSKLARPFQELENLRYSDD